ncbi:hypothetical protein J6590_033422 [Homalodisca vitripennis]|nr:hypothetical protein J6590_033422 [Homalodisca vitripennis]
MVRVLPPLSAVALDVSQQTQTTHLLSSCHNQIFSSVVRRFLRWYVFFLRCLLWPLTSLGSLTPRTPCLPVTNRLLLLPAVDLAKIIRTRQVTCTEVVEAYISRAKEVNPLVNAIVQDRFQEALVEAEEIDGLLSSGKLSVEHMENNLPLLGVPLTVKETIAVRGMSNNGAWSLVPSHTAREDADIVRLLREAGAIPLLVSNTPELCMNWETDNPRVGRTNNPYDPRRTPGGSSGGEAALLGSAASVVGVASDIGGSLRLPAMFTGVYGHKPTPGYVSNRGHRPSSQDGCWDHYFTLGPMCRYARDLPVILNTIVADPRRARELRLDEQVDLTKVKVFYMEDDGPERMFTDSVNSDMKTAMRTAVHYLREKYGLPVKQVSIQGLENIVSLSTLIMLRMNGIPNVYQRHQDSPDEWNSVLYTIGKRLLGLTTSSTTCLMYAPLKALVDSIPDEEFGKLLKRKELLMDRFKDMLGEDGVFLYPVFPTGAHFHGQIYFKFLNSAYLTLFNMLEMPVTACPMGLDKNGLPVGIQISAWQKQDRLTIAVARALEQEFGGWIPPCPIPD